MARGSTELDNYEYDQWLAKNKKERELRERQAARRSANKGYSGWHFGIDDKPVYAKDKQDFISKLQERNLEIKDER